MSDEAKATAAIEAILARQDAAWADGDAAAFAADVRSDVVFTNIVGMFSVGRAPFEAQHQPIFATIYQGSVVKQEVAHLVFVRSDVAIVDTVAALTGFNALPPGAGAVDGVLRTRLEQVMVCDQGKWCVASFHNVPINPHAQAAAPSPEDDTPDGRSP